jgi:hypothetical protein
LETPSQGFDWEWGRQRADKRENPEVHWPPTFEDWTAIATIGLACATFDLAFFTWRVSRFARADAEAQWRPLTSPPKKDHPGLNTLINQEDGDDNKGN